MPNKVFNNEGPSNIKPESVFYGKMDSSGVRPGPSFKTGEGMKNPTIDYGNSWSQKIKTSQVVTKTNKSGIMFR